MQSKILDKNIDELVTKRDLLATKQEIELKFTAEIAPLKWGIAVCVGGVIALVIKAFFHG